MGDRSSGVRIRARFMRLLVSEASPAMAAPDDLAGYAPTASFTDGARLDLLVEPHRRLFRALREPGLGPRVIIQTGDRSRMTRGVDIDVGERGHFHRLECRDP